MSRPFPPRQSAYSGPRVNGKIRAREVRVINSEGKQIGVYSLNEALSLARSQGLDLVEIAPTAIPPVCRVVDFGKFRYEQSKKDKESKKHQHANRVKEIQLSPKIDPHDLGVKLGHATEFLCEDMKVKVALRFKGREMAHTDIGFQVVNKFLNDVSPYGQPDAEPKLLGRNINVMISPLPRNKRAKSPRELAESGQPVPAPAAAKPSPGPQPKKIVVNPFAGPSAPGGAGFTNNPFGQLDVG